MSQYRVAVVGATGAVGTTMMDLLAKRGYPASEIVPFASERSAGRTSATGASSSALHEDDDRRLRRRDLLGRRLRSPASGRRASPLRGAIVVDNSSAFRGDHEVPLVVSEVNPDALDAIGKGIVANPNCTTMAIMLPLKALHDAFGLKAFVATSFQAAGGAGQKGIDELVDQIPLLYERREQLVDDGAAALEGIEHSIHNAPLAFNVVPWLGTDTGNGYTDEEMKMV